MSWQARAALMLVSIAASLCAGVVLGARACGWTP